MVSVNVQSAWKGLTVSSQGPVVRIAPNEYSVDDPEAMKTIYGHGTKFVKVGKCCENLNIRVTDR